MDTVFFLSGLEDDIYGKVLDVMEKYGRLELKGQRATKKTNKICQTGLGQT